MKKFNYTVLWLGVWMSIAGGTISCDTEKNVEDPDLHYFVKYYGGDGNQSGVDMEVLADGSMLLLGNSLQGNFNSDVYLVHVDSEGGVIDERTFQIGPNENSGTLTATDLEPAGDGNFIILADYRKNLGDLTQMKLLKVSPDGVVLDSIEGLGTEANDFSRSATLVDDGGFIVTGTTEFTETFTLASSPDPDLGDFFNYRLDANLDPLPMNDWDPISPGFGGKLDVAVKAVQAGNEFFVFGYSNINISDTNRDKRLGFFYFQRDSTGGEANPYFPGNAPNKDTEIHDVRAVPAQMGGGYIVVGTSRDNFDISEIFIARMRSSLTFVNIGSDATLYNTIPVGRNVRGVSATSSVITGSYGYIVLGNEIRSTGASNIWVTKIDQSGAILWSSTFGAETENDTGAAVRELPDGKIVILGTVSLADNQSKMALIKVNSVGQLLK